jgi:hypothetical protein
MAKNFKTFQAKMTQEARSRSQVKAQRMIQEVTLDELRAAQEAADDIWEAQRAA